MTKKHLTAEELEQTTIIEGWVWPLKDSKCWPWLQNEKDLPNLISKHCKNKSVVVEAGGNAGFYVKQYAEIFKTVYTFEPDHLNFYCLSNNVKERNVIKFQTCLGNERKLIELTTSKRNIGAYYIAPNAQGITPTLLIDDLNLPVCDLIHLDIEGFEYYALKGAVETIKRTKPVIALEWMNHGEARYGSSNNDIEKFLNELGYKSVEKIYHENIFVYQL